MEKQWRRGNGEEEEVGASTRGRGEGGAEEFKYSNVASAATHARDFGLTNHLAQVGARTMCAKGAL